MEPKFQTSFIPKSPISTGTKPSFSVGISFTIMGTLSTVAIIVALTVSGALFGYTRYVQQQVNESQLKLTQAKSAFESEEDAKIVLVSNQIKTVKDLLSKHISVTPLFELFQKNTLPTVRMSSLTVLRAEEGIVSITMNLEAQSYASLAQQTKVFSTLPLLKAITVADVNLTDTGVIEVKLTTQVDESALLYSNKLKDLSSVETTPDIL